jgi:CheY-like chemotaxis protein
VPAANAADGPAETPARGETVLVVEDDDDVRALTVALLRGFGYTVIEARDAGEALSVLGPSGRVDLLLSDVVLPGGTTGPELAIEARRRQPDMKILFMSGYAEDMLADHGDAIPGADLLRKPFRKADLARKLRAVLHRDTVEDDANAIP